jgi:uncharacterized RDD family membrane protein YckC
MTAEAPRPSTPGGWAAPPPAATGPSAGLRYGGFWVRVVAYILDVIVIGVLSAALSALTGSGSVVSSANGVIAVDYASSSIGFLISLVYFVGFWAWRGQTPGMIPFNMQVVMASDGSKVDVVRCLLRYVGLIISFAILFLGVIWVGFDRRKQGWHDKMASTVVVRPT